MTENLWTRIQKIQYKGTPVFGRDSNPQNTSEFVAIAGTVLFWLLMLLFFIFAKPFAKKPEFKTVQIVLSSTPVAKTEKKESAAAASAPAQQAASSEKQIKKTEQVKEAPAPAPAKSTKKIADTPKKSAEKAAAKPAESNKAAKAPDKPFVPQGIDMSDESNFFTSTPAKKEASWDSAHFKDDEASDDTSSVTQTTKVESSSSISKETAGTVANNSSGVNSIQEKNGSINQNVSADTIGALNGVREAKVYVGNAGSSHSSELTASLSNGSGKNQFAMTDGSSRGLLEPADPRIDLSEQAASLIDSTINVTIFIEVQPSGNVTSVDFNPSSIVPPLVQSEIRAQLVGKWRFERADYSSMGKFQYTIKKL